MTYSRLKDHHFNLDAPLPELMEPSGLPPPGVVFRHGNISSQKLIERIGLGHGCPTILLQAKGTRIIWLNYRFSNSIVSICVDKI